jgi:hypothetical protein
LEFDKGNIIDLTEESTYKERYSPSCALLAKGDLLVIGMSNSELDEPYKKIVYGLNKLKESSQ